MGGRAQFIQTIENLITNNPNAFSAEALEYWETLKAEPAKTDITEKGMLILKHMADNKDICNNVFTAQLIGAGIQLTGRSVSGAMKKLLTVFFSLILPRCNKPVRQSIRQCPFS